MKNLKIMGVIVRHHKACRTSESLYNILASYGAFHEEKNKVLNYFSSSTKIRLYVLTEHENAEEMNSYFASMSTVDDAKDQS